MIYTVGHKENYESAIKEHGTIHKLGETVDYGGGIVFETIEDANQYLDEIGMADKWCVWGVDADWITDTKPADDGWWCYLLFDAEIIPLNKVQITDNVLMETVTVKNIKFTLLPDGTARNAVLELFIELVNGEWQLIQQSDRYHMEWLPDGSIKTTHLDNG